jgi:4-coumarate--CoA ligase
MPRIYRASQPPIPIPECSIFTQVFSKLRGRQWQTPRTTQHASSSACSKPEEPRVADSCPAYTEASTGRVLTHVEVYNQSLQLAWGLRTVLNVKRGDTIAIYSSNSIEWPVLLLGAIAAGLRVTTVNSSYTPHELLHQLSVCICFVLRHEIPRMGYLTG